MPQVELTLPDTGKLRFTKAEFEAMIRDHRDLKTAIETIYSRFPSRVELIGGMYEVDYRLQE